MRVLNHEIRPARPDREIWGDSGFVGRERMSGLYRLDLSLEVSPEELDSFLGFMRRQQGGEYWEREPTYAQPRAELGAPAPALDPHPPVHVGELLDAPATPRGLPPGPPRALPPRRR